MTALEPRLYSTQRDIERQLSLFTAQESTEVLARATANIFFTAFRHRHSEAKLMELFKLCFNQEHSYLQGRSRNSGAS
jgi:hypothetical protein